MKRGDDSAETSIPLQPIASVRLLPDVPTEDDAFGAHVRLAAALAELIEREEGGKAIALEGGWGSGKSSVIEMLKRRLERAGDGPASTSTYVFDAWSHEGDPLRRVFLEELTAFCQSRFSAGDREEWDKRKKSEISGRTKEVDQTSVPVLLSPLPLLALGFLAIFPIAVAAVGGLVRQDLANTVVLWALAVSGGIALLLPLGLFILFIYCSWPFWPFSRCRWFDSRIGKAKKREHAGRLISLYAKKTDETTRTTAHESSGPTSIEFQRYFSDLLASYLADTRHRLVIVLDNLDRVPTSTARMLWTTLRVFAECCENKRNSAWARRVWYVVPYDPDAARRLWDDGDDHVAADYRDVSAEQKSQAGEHAGGKITMPVAPRLSAAFLDKTFQVRFDVPPLLLSEWKSYLTKLLQDALGDACASDEEGMHRVYLLSRRMAEQKRRPPTPRHLKLYVNDIGALYRRYEGAFPVDHLAIYAILRRQGHDVRLWLLEAVEEQKHFTSILGESYIASLRAMAHGTTDTQRARDLHLRGPIEASLANGNDAELVLLMDVPGFWQVLEIVCNESATAFGFEESRVVNAIEVVEKAKLLEGAGPEKAALRHFLEDLARGAEWKQLNANTGRAAACAIRSQLGSQAIESVSARLAGLVTPEQIEAAEPKAWLAGVQLIVNEAELTPSVDIGHIPVVPSDKCGPMLAAIGSLADSEANTICRYLRFEGAVDDFLTAILPQPDSEWKNESYRALRSILRTPASTLKAKPVADQVAARMRFDGDLTVKEIERLVGSLADIRIRDEKAGDECVRALSKEGVLFRRIKDCEKQLNSITVARLIEWVIEFVDLGTAPSTPTNAAEGHIVARKVGETPGDYPVVVAHLISSPNAPRAHTLLDCLLCEVSSMRPLVASIVQQLRSDSVFGERLSAERFVGRYDELSELFDAEGEIDVVCAELLQNTSFVDSLASIEITDETFDGVVALIRRGGMASNAQFEGKVKEYLRTRSKDQWKESVRSSDAVCDLLVAVRSADATFLMTGDYPGSIEEIMAEALDGTVAFEPSALDKWNACVAAIAEHEQDTIAARVVERADAPDRHFNCIIPLFSDRLRSAAVRHSEESFVRNALIPLVRNNRGDLVEWVVSVAMAGPRFWANTSNSDRETFAQEITGAISNVDDGTKEQLLLLASSLGLTIVEPTVVDDAHEQG